MPTLFIYQINKSFVVLSGDDNRDTHRVKLVQVFKEEWISFALYLYVIQEVFVSWMEVLH